MTSSNKVSFADDFRRAAHSVRINRVDGISVEDGPFPSFRKGSILVTVKPAVVEAFFSPDWLGMSFSLKEKDWNNFGDAIGWVFYFLDMYGPGNDLLEEMEIIQQQHSYDMVLSLSVSIRTHHIRGEGTFDVSDIPDHIDYSYTDNSRKV